MREIPATAKQALWKAITEIENEVGIVLRVREDEYNQFVIWFD